MGGLIAQIIMNEMFRYILKLAEELKGVIKEGLNDREEAGEIVGKGASGEDTKAIDRLAEDFIVDNLTEFRLHIVTEEAGVIKSSSTPEKIAVIDPLDGTFNALHNLPFYSFSIALAKYSENATMEDINFGFVMDLVTGEYFHAERGEGSFFMGNKINVRDIPLDKGTLSLYSPPGSTKRLIPLLENTRRLRIMGSAALDLCYIARGDLQAFVDIRNFLRNVDTAAGLLILEEAGGKISDLRGRTLRNSILNIEKFNLVAASPDVHNQVLHLLNMT